MLSISTDEHHQQQIPYEKVENAIFACKELQIPYTVAICTENEEERAYKLLIEKLTKITSFDNIRTAITFPSGRALDEIDKSRYAMSDNPPESACSAGSSPIIFPDGRIIACIGPVIDLKSNHPLVLGDLRSDNLETILENAEINPILHTIRIWGPRKLISIIAKSEYRKYLPQNYISKSICNACYSLMKNENLLNFLNSLSEDRKFRQMVAYAIVYYLNEMRMAYHYGLANNKATETI